MDGGKYSVPHELIDTRVWARFSGDELIVTASGDELIVTASGDDGPVEVARHQRTRPGSRRSTRRTTRPARVAAHPKATAAAEAAFLALGPGAASYR